MNSLRVHQDNQSPGRWSILFNALVNIIRRPQHDSSKSRSHILDLVGHRSALDTADLEASHPEAMDSHVTADLLYLL